MGELTFKGLKVDELDLTNKIEGQVELDISQRASFNVKYSNDNLHCMANLTIDMMEKTHPMDFNFKISATALFDCEEGMDKKEIHKKAYDEIYPHVRALVITFMVNSGLPPIVIPKVKMDESNIKIEENKKKRSFMVRTLSEDVKDDALFEAIVDPFKGKVVLVDFWATWCGPCKMAMKMMKPMKEELIDKDIVYVFIAGENSPETTWNNMIPDIHGEHYRLTNAQWAAICDKFEVRGVPTYLVLDRAGKQTYRSVGFPGTDTVKGELLKALNSSAD